MKTIFILLFLPITVFAQKKSVILLNGAWEFQLDSSRVGEAEHWYENNLPLKIQLPGSIDEGGFGKKHLDGVPLYDGKPEIYRLARKHSYIGAAWYRKEFILPSDWKGEQIYLNLERCMWQTKLWINGAYGGGQNSLSTPHQYEISKFLRAGKNSVAIRIDNAPQVNLGSWSHGYSPEVQTVWNGVIGNIELRKSTPVHFSNVQVYPSFKKKLLQVKMSLHNPAGQRISGKVKLTIKGGDKSIVSFTQEIRNQATSEPLIITVPINDKLNPWNEFKPSLYTLQVDGVFGNNNSDRREITFGVRDIKAEEGRLVLNGNKIFLRGEHDGGSFPLTGYPSMNKEKWLEIFRTGKSYGLNHWRFHSWCPPEAAFEAADEVGMLLQVELPLFSQTWEKSLVGKDPKIDEFLHAELVKVLDAYGNHPSFGLMCIGNELKGDPKFLEKLVAFGKNYDSRHLYAGSANLEAMGLYERLKGDEFQVAHAGKYKGRRFERRMKDYFSTEKPNTDKDFAYTLQPPYNEWPVISHEVGQWMVYPDFREIKEYTGILKPRNLEIFKSRLQQKGMLNQASDFLNASGKLSALLYREEIERLLRTPQMAGFQLLDLRDYPGQGSAMVGLLNQFWESKGLITPKEFRNFCNDVTLLLKMPKRVCLNNETFSADLVIPNYSIANIASVDVKWEVIADGKTIKEGSLSSNNLKQGDVNNIGKLSFDLSSISRASKLTIKLKEAQLGVVNSYEIFVYPAINQVEIPQSISVATSADSALLKKIEDGATVLLVTNKLPETERMTFTTPFWSTIIFDYQIKTMGILCNPQHPVFKDFPTEFYSNWQWWELTNNARVMRLNKTAPDYRPTIQVIDHPVRNDKLGAMVETRIGKGKLLLCTLDILSDPNNRYVARQLFKSTVEYMTSPAFDPKENKDLAEIIFNKSNTSTSEVLSVKSSSEDPESPALFAFDGDMESSWKTDAKAVTARCTVELVKPRFVTGCKIKVSDDRINPTSFSVYVTDNPEQPGQPLIEGKIPGNDVFEAKQWDNGFTVQNGKKAKFIILEIKTQQRAVIPVRVSDVQWIFGD